MNSEASDRSSSETPTAWDVVARAKYRGEFEDHVRLLKAGGHNLLDPELAVLEPLLPGAHVVHLQCSHGLDALGLLNAGAGSVAGIDISDEMVTQARAKAKAVGVPADFYRADAVEPPDELAGTADIVYTGRGALPWIRDLTAWAAAVKKILRPGGRLFLFEGHPLDALWDRDSRDLSLREGVSYFDQEPREAPGFPASVVTRELGADRPKMLEHAWRPGQVIDRLVTDGFTLEHFDEHPTLYWDQFPDWPERLKEILPHTYSVLARV